MNADLYVQGRFWATISIPGDSLLALFAEGMVTHAAHQAELLQENHDMLGTVACSIHMRYTGTPAIKSPTHD